MTPRPDPVAGTLDDCQHDEVLRMTLADDSHDWQCKGCGAFFIPADGPLREVEALFDHPDARDHDETLPNGAGHTWRCIPIAEAIETVATSLPADPQAVALLREAAMGWEPGPGPFTVSLPTVNRILNLLQEKRAR